MNAHGGEDCAHIAGEVPVVMRDGKAFACVFDRGAAQLPPGQPAMCGVHRADAGEQLGVETLSGPQIAIPPARKRSASRRAARRRAL